MQRPMQRVLLAVSGVALVLLLGCLARLGSQHAAGPAHIDFSIGIGTPATLYLPYGEGTRLSEPPPREKRPPAVVLMHGFASDRFNMSPLARSIARAGYGVLAIDVAGHGMNRSGRFELARGQRGAFFDELEAAVHFLRASRYVDGERIVMMGHSMGAGASLAYGSLDPTVDGLVMIAGGRLVPGPHRPANALFIYAENDPERIKTSSAALAAEIAGEPGLAEGALWGDFERGTAVKHAEVPGVDHVTIVISDLATRQIVEWLDATMGNARAEPAGLDDPRVATAAVSMLLLLLVLPGLGVALASLSPSTTRAPGAASEGAGLFELGVFAIALVAALPLIAVGPPLPALSLVLGDLVIPYLGAAGLAVLFALAALGRIDAASLFASPGRSVAVAGLGLFSVMALLVPQGVVFHNLAPTPERALIVLASTAILFPLFLAIEGALRHPPAWRGVVVSLVGRAAVLLAIGGGTSLGVLPGVVFLMLPILTIFLLLLELPAWAMRAAGGSALLAALFQAAMLAWILAVVLPVRV